jgi:TIGR03009 family protein
MLPPGTQRMCGLVVLLGLAVVAGFPGRKAHAQGAASKKSAVRPAVNEASDADEEVIPLPRVRRQPGNTSPDEPRGAREVPEPSRNKKQPSAGRSDERAADEDRRLPRPKTQPLRVEKLSAELEEILIEWEQRTAKFERLTGDVVRFEYNHVFQTESRGEGTFAFQSPDLGSIRIVGSKIGRKDESRVKDENDVPYKLIPANPERWISNGSEIIQIDDKAKTFLRIEIPPERRGKRIIESPLPFLFGMSVEHARSRYHLKLVRSTANQFQLEVRPRWSGDSSNWVRAYVIISRKTFVPEAVKLIQAGEEGHELERTYRFSNVRINGEGGFLAELFGGEDPFRPRLRGYKEAILDSSAPAVQRPAETKKAAASNQGAAQPARAAGAAGNEAAGKRPAAQRK